MTISIDVLVLEITVDTDGVGNQYSHIAFGHVVPQPIPPHIAQLPIGQRPAPPVLYKHDLHVMVPRDKWFGQYQQWDTWHLIIHDDGNLELKKA